MRAMHLAACGLLVAGAGCGGARSSLTFDSLKYPASTSPVLIDPTGRGFRVVGRLEHETTAYALFYSLIPLTPSIDVSAAMNEQVRAAGGDGVINVTIDSQGCKMNAVWPFAWLPIWPGCTTATVYGQIVRINRPGEPTRREVELGPPGPARPSGGGAAPGPARRAPDAPGPDRSAPGPVRGAPDAPGPARGAPTKTDKPKRKAPDAPQGRP